MKEILVRSSQVYYHFLEENALGLEEIKILSFSLNDEEISFSLKGKVFNPESLILRIEDEEFLVGEEGLEQKYFDERSNNLCLSIDKNIHQKLTKTKKERVFLFSDLKFLVKNVENYFETISDLNFPDSCIGIEPIISKEPTLEQALAIKNIFSHPLTYVWGPPGSGKTQIVLFESLFSLIQAGKKVCVLAPTNNSLEQVLKTLIKKFDALELNREKILRLGMPTSGFLNTYIEVCDPNILKKSAPQSLFSYAFNFKDRLKEALVVGMTVDGFIRRYKALEVKFDHIFLDECAFTPLIKACALCVDNTPLTFLGDHKQLSPICQMPEMQIAQEENFYANLWNLSALNLEEFLMSKNFERENPIFSKSQYQEVEFKNICVMKLTKTHRYGDNLARILDGHIYKNGLRGTKLQTELFYVDSKREPKDKTHTSINEAKNALELVQTFWGSDYAVLTPFVKQRRQMIEVGIPREKVWTIHSSQGQEFDTVIFSPVCLHYHLTNSSNIKALYALNVAISRIKKRLIIVCDYDFWKSQNGQFIKNILELCSPFEAMTPLPF
ncbi:AAA domain-containing protein [Helicobacter sp. 12S02232-10]|uniref:AAA domain-containing protein n=1 Tax=Helicobacter sp. 12S02232-10 TaxID=1476197 RepID=UPI002150AE86|nr:AAA domain-containing protein [Helicobacter sp. 12S02232-10]